jgi:hypothetical protein
MPTMRVKSGSHACVCRNAPRFDCLDERPVVEFDLVGIGNRELFNGGWPNGPPLLRLYGVGEVC